MTEMPSRSNVMRTVATGSPAMPVGPTSNSNAAIRASPFMHRMVPGRMPEWRMRTPQALQALIDDGVIDEVVRPLKSGKEAAVSVVHGGGEVRCAKVYKDMAQRSFQQRVQYQEGRKVRGSREARSEEHPSELQSHMRSSSAVICLKTTTKTENT